MNVVTLVGRTTKEVELKYGQNGKAYARFTLAIPRSFAKGEADFINCVAFGKTAELIGEYVKKGNRIAVNGSIQTSFYEVNGERKKSFDIFISTVEFLESKNKENNEDMISSNNIPDDDEFPF